jgi:hypothetical protein
MGSTFKDRDEHRGIPAPHLGLDHYEKSKVEERATGCDRGPTFDANSTDDRGEFHEQPQQPVDVNRLARESVENGTEGIDREKRPEEVKKAVKDLDDGLAVKH